MIKKMFVFISVVMMLLACSGEETRSKRTIEDFSFLKKGISYQQIVSTLGEPDKELGSGAYVYVYSLSDGTSVTLSFINLDKLYSARLLDKNGELIRTIIAP